MSAKDKKSEAFSHHKKAKGEFLCKVEENIDVCGAKPVAKMFTIRCHLERHLVDIFKHVLETDEAKTRSNNCKQYCL